LRVDVLTLPDQGCVPLYGFDPGDRVLLDRQPARIGVGDAVLFRGPGGELWLGRVSEPPQVLPEKSLWVLAERERCPGADSLSLGPLARADVVAKLVARLTD
jgi:hypothetical protein